ncbi:hypothetical protein U9M48_030442 [Paspalum notatum var. saurae]|uniref:Uncharacterized protein n=1 Tax=Paspalum notatum var. saurae TaxID=547442 RepID=A0AAQ3X393_PASNO
MAAPRRFLAQAHYSRSSTPPRRLAPPARDGPSPPARNLAPPTGVGPASMLPARARPAAHPRAADMPLPLLLTARSFSPSPLHGDTSSSPLRQLVTLTTRQKTWDGTAACGTAPALGASPRCSRWPCGRYMTTLPFLGSGTTGPAHAYQSSRHAAAAGPGLGVDVGGGDVPVVAEHWEPGGIPLLLAAQPRAAGLPHPLLLAVPLCTATTSSHGGDRWRRRAILPKMYRKGSPFLEPPAHELSAFRH